MAITARERTHAQDEEEGYFVSMTDMMVGMLFMFIIMLMFFAMKFNEAAVAHRETVQDLIGADETRKGILTEIGRALEMQGVRVVIDTDNGILRLPENILFNCNESVLTAQGRDALNKLTVSLGRVLPCYTFLPNRDRPAECSAQKHSVESIFVEGHTDSDGDADLNWRLSMARSLHTYQTLTGGQSELGSLQNRDEKPVLSIAGYGKQRPVKPNDTPENKRYNRRIDLRFIMSPPDAKELNVPSREIRP